MVAAREPAAVTAKTTSRVHPGISIPSMIQQLIQEARATAASGHKTRAQLPEALAAPAAAAPAARLQVGPLPAAKLTKEAHKTISAPKEKRGQAAAEEEEEAAAAAAAAATTTTARTRATTTTVSEVFCKSHAALLLVETKLCLTVPVVARDMCVCVCVCVSGPRGGAAGASSENNRPLRVGGKAHFQCLYHHIFVSAFTLPMPTE